MSRTYAHLTEEQVESFLTRGFVHVQGAIAPSLVQEWTAQAFTRLGYAPDDPATWVESRIHMPTHQTREVKEFSPAAWGAICDLCGGENRVRQPCKWGDGFIINLGAPDHAETWEPPTPQVGGWHKDGDFFRHFLDSPEQGLLTIILWSDVLPQGGATFVACDSVPVVARYLLEHPEGSLPGEFNFRGMVEECSDFIEATGKAGDVYLLHPYILHASSKNALRLPRLITNPAVALNEPMNFDRPDGDYSLVEQAILNGLGVDRLPFAISGERQRVTPERVRRQQQMLEDEKARLAGVAG
ncbi:MAG: hypothetical protein OHK0029_07190 [Armatimonadaceae bacterium]